MSQVDPQPQSTGDQSNSSQNAPNLDALSKIDIGFVLKRAQAVLKNPTGVWDEISAANESISDVYLRYTGVLAAVTPLATFIGLSILGPDGFFSGLVRMVVFYVIGLAGFYVAALILNFLAPKFDGNGDLNQAFRLSAFSATASQIGGIFSISLALSPIGILFSLYSLYTFYSGIPRMLGVPEARRLPFFGVAILCMAVVGVVVSVFILGSFATTAVVTSQMG